MMIYQDKTKDELSEELQKLQQEYEILKNSYEKNISERKQTEEALKESQYLYETLSLVSPVGIFRTDPKGYTTYVNPKWSELSGLSPDDAYGNGWLNAVHPETSMEGKIHSDLSEEVKEDSLSILRKSSDRLLNTITDYIDTSMLTSGNMSVHKKSFVPAQLLRNKFDNYKKEVFRQKAGIVPANSGAIRKFTGQFRSGIIP